MTGHALEYAVHIDGVVATAKDVEPLDDAKRHLAHLRYEGGAPASAGEAIYRTPVYAVALAQALKRHEPDDLVTIVFWTEDGR